jgi:hypothetical protein
VAYQINKIKDEILVIDNVVPESFQNSIIARVQGDQHFPWFLLHRIGHPDHYGVGTTPAYVDANITDDVGFFHMAFDGNYVSPYYDFFRAILEFFSEKTNIEITNILRIRLRYTHKGKDHDEFKYAAPHVDFNTGHPYCTLVYYVNDSDGDTIIFDKIFNPQEEIYDPVFSEPISELVRVTPRKGQGLFFNGHRYHAGNYPVKCSSRIVINFDFEIKQS